MKRKEELSKISKVKSLIEKNSSLLQEMKKKFNRGQRGYTREARETTRVELKTLTKQTRHMYIAYGQMREIPRILLEAKTPRAGEVDEKLLTEILKLISR